MFFRPWVGVDQVGAKRNCTLRNIVGQTISGVGLQLAGSNLASGTYLSGQGLTAAQQTDLMTFSLDGFSINQLVVSGAITARNGKIDAGGTILNPVTIQDDCIEAIFDNVQVLNGTGDGVRANIAGTGVWSPVRGKMIRLNGGLVAGNVTGFSLNNVLSANISQVRIGYNSGYDGVSETTQTVGVNINSGADGVVCDSNFVSVAGGGTAYTITGTGSSGCNIVNPLGTVTSTGQWEFNGVGNASTTTLTDKTTAINSSYKYFGKLCVNSSTNKMFVAQGSVNTSTWISVDGATTITPV